MSKFLNDDAEEDNDDDKAIIIYQVLSENSEKHYGKKNKCWLPVYF